MESRGGSKVLERNSLQGINAIKKKYPDCADIAGNIGNTPQGLEASPLVSSGNFLSNECAHNIHGKPFLGDSGIGAFLG